MNSTTSPTSVTNPIVGLEGHKDRIIKLAFSPDRCHLASVSHDGMGRLWDVAHRKPRDRGTVSKSGESLHALAFSANGRRLAVGSGSLNGFIWVYDVSEKQPNEVAVLRGARGSIDALAFSPDSKLVAGSGEDRTLRLWEPYPGTTGAPRTQLAGHGGPIRAMAFAPDGITMATAGADLTLRVWSLSRIRSTERAAVPLIAEINAMTYFVDGKTVASAGADGVIRLWDMTAMTPRVRAELKGHDGAVRELVMTPDGKALASVGDDLRVINWDPQSGKPMQQWQLAVEGASAFALTLDGRYLACGTATGKLDLYRVAEKR